MFPLTIPASLLGALAALSDFVFSDLDDQALSLQLVHTTNLESDEEWDYLTTIRVTGPESELSKLVKGMQSLRETVLVDSAFVLRDGCAELTLVLDDDPGLSKDELRRLAEALDVDFVTEEYY